MLTTHPRSSAAPSRIPLHDHWRFALGDPAGVDSNTLLYDVRPVVTEDDARRRAEDTDDAQTLPAPVHRVLKPWILPTGNRFIKDPARRHIRPEGHPGEDLPFVRPDFDDSAWQPVTLPHDWAIHGPFNRDPKGVGGGMGRLPSPGIGWYRRQITLDDADLRQSLFLDIDGAMSHSTVWLNGKLVGGWPYGYTSYRLDLTPYAKPGVNQLAIRLDNPPDFSRWYPGAGLYRSVWLVKSSPVHVAQWGTSITTPAVSASFATIRIETSIDNDLPTQAPAEVVTDIYELDSSGLPQGNPVATLAPTGLLLNPHSTALITASVAIESPKLWGPPPHQHPHLYLAVTTIRHDGNLLDTQHTRFGIRQIACKSDGVHVNGQRVPLQGVNQHHDLGALGAAFNRRAAQRQLETLHELGCNAIRMAHNPPAPELLDLADEMGFLVIDEAFDAWVRRKTPCDFHLIFPDWHEQDTRAMIRRDRNHPSVFLWSVGNEVGEQHTGDSGATVARKLAEIAREADPTRPVTASMNFAKADSPFAAAFDVISLNYQGEGIRDTPEFENFTGIRTPPQYDNFHKKFPNRTLLSSESAATFSSRGVYHFPVPPGSSNPTRDTPGGGGNPKTMQVSAYELHTADFGSSPDKVFAALDRHPFVAGEFVWTGWDYLGEPSPYYDARSSYFGVVDLAGFKKDRFYLYQSRWRPELPFAHILPHWTWPKRLGQITPVHVFSSADEAELFVNGKSQGLQRKAPFQYRFRWDDVKYEPGEVQVFTRKNGRPWASASVRTAGETARLDASADRVQLTADGNDLAFITVRILDAHGTLSPRSSRRVHFHVSGPADLVATDNGDPTCFESFQSPHRAAFNGLLLGILRTRTEPGLISLTLASDGLPSTTLRLLSNPPTLPTSQP